MGSFIPPSLDDIFTGNYNLSVFQIIIYWVNVFSDTFIQYLNIRKCEYLMVTLFQILSKRYFRLFCAIRECDEKMSWTLKYFWHLSYYFFGGSIILRYSKLYNYVYKEFFQNFSNTWVTIFLQKALFSVIQNCATMFLTLQGLGAGGSIRPPTYIFLHCFWIVFLLTMGLCDFF